MQLTQKELIEKLATEIGRLQKLCKDNGIDYLPPQKNPGATLGVTAKVTVFSTKEEADEALKKSQEIS